MDTSLIAVAWDCIKTHYPALVAAGAQIVGGASILLGLSRTKVGGALGGFIPPAFGGIFDKIKGFLGTIAINPK